ncbi:hypothetical protein BpHYR1_054577 [Brachionus plicatilis]|uniref:Uncharacterized protein n=1 Tax=Brachionus plicatilis TaxID=10195 RepID=A0A3M7R7Z4_BRAPC|nr:hypothetical protein BpHYR1_054577 [Brachionus plicatilis]
MNKKFYMSLLILYVINLNFMKASIHRLFIDVIYDAFLKVLSSRFSIDFCLMPDCATASFVAGLANIGIGMLCRGFKQNLQQ